MGNVSIQVGQKYRHFRNNRLYEVLMMGTCTETQGTVVIYKSVIEGDIYVRPIDQWGQLMVGDTPRFQLIEG